MHEEDIADYENAIKFLGYKTPEEAYIELRKYHSLRDITLLNTRIAPSGIQGRGVFAEKDISINSVIEKAIDGTYTTQVGKYVNHSKMPNAKIQYIGKDLYLASILDITHNSEITIDYRTIIILRG